MTRRSTRLGVALACLVVVPIAAWKAALLTDTLPRVSAAQQLDREFLDQPVPEPEGRNGFNWLAVLPCAMTDQEFETLSHEGFPPAIRDPARQWTKGNTGCVHHPRIALPDMEQAPCRPWLGRCLDAVRTDVDASRTWLESAEALRSRFEHLHAFDFVREPADREIALSVWSIFQHSPAAIEVARAALHHMDEDPLAVEPLCRFASTWRRFARHSDSTPFKVKALIQVAQAATVYAEIVADQPGPWQPPQTCEGVFEPLQPDEVDLCAAARAEFVWLKHVLERMRPGPQGSLSDRIEFRRRHNANYTLARAAERLAPSCSSHPRHHAVSLQLNGDDLVCSRMAVWANPKGCLLLTLISSPARHTGRVAWADARLRAVANALWLSGQADPATAFESRPSHLRMQGFDLELDLVRSVVAFRGDHGGQTETVEVPFRR